MARKVFISFLGTSPYDECIYTRGDYESQSVRFIQEATLEYINRREPWTNGDVAHILLTKQAELKNWEDNGQKDRDGNYYSGLKTRLENLGLPIEVMPISNIPNGNNEQEIMELFMRVFKELNEGDELYFDVTHGFRILPMLALVLGNYAKFLKKVTVKSITYGNWEARWEIPVGTPDKKSYKAPIIDMTVLSNLQDWTHAAADFLDNGSPEKISKLSNEMRRKTKGGDAQAVQSSKMSSRVESFVDDLVTCRGMNVVNAKSVKSLLEQLNQEELNLAQPMRPIIEKLKSAIVGFDVNRNVANGFAAARWCVDHGMYQQAITFIEETMISYFAERNGIDIENEKERGLVTSVMHEIVERYRNEIDGKMESLRGDEMLRNIEVLNAFNCVVELRNDMNHCGFRANKCSPKNIVKQIENKLEVLERIILNQTPTSHATEKN